MEPRDCGAMDAAVPAALDRYSKHLRGVYLAAVVSERDRGVGRVLLSAREVYIFLVATVTQPVRQTM